MNLDSIYKEVASELNLPVDVVEKAYRSMFKCYAEKIKGMNLDNKYSEKEFNKLRCSFNVPSVGKFFCHYKWYKKITDRKELYNKLKQNAKDKKD